MYLCIFREDELQILLATSNKHKLREVREILEPLGVIVTDLESLDGSFDEPVEDADTFEENARLKARGYAQSTNLRCLADDSGLVVDALNGQPGVRSARYAGIGETREERDAANNALLIDRVQHLQESERTARFVCAMCVAEPDGTIVAESVGTFEGMITTEPRGQNGFGYDPLLLVPQMNKTSAELSPEEKNALSHRGHALRAIAKHLAS